MYLLFVDEFGHENPTAEGQAPVFGYGGFIIPASAFSEFSTEFFDIKVAAFRPLYQARLKASRDRSDAARKSRSTLNDILARLSTESSQAYFRDKALRRAVARYEIKGSDVFSTSYLAKLARKAEQSGHPAALGKQGRTMVRFATWLAKTLRHYNGEIFYVGFHRTQRPMMKRNERIHTWLMSDVIDRAYEFAKAKNAVVKIIFDHHYTDIGPSIGPGGSQQKGFVEKSRSDRAREIVMSKDYFENLTEPVFNAKSHLSQGIQAADWICALLKILLIQRSEHRGQISAFTSRIEQVILGNVADQAIFRMAPKFLNGRLFERQEQLPLHGGAGSDPMPRRPYSKSAI